MEIDSTKKSRRDRTMHLENSEMQEVKGFKCAKLLPNKFITPLYDVT